MTSPIQPDLGPHNPREDPFLIWFREGLANLLYEAGRAFGPEVFDGIPPRLDAVKFAVLDAVHVAKGRLVPHTPVGFRLDTTDIEPTEGA